MNTTPTQPATPLPVGQILVGDALSRLKGLPNDSIDTVVTSPPYFRLRNYDNPDQIGLEDTITEWVTNLVAIFDEIQRVLKPSGSVWLNLGDSYSRHARHGAPKKSLLLGPERLLVALSDRGWLVRNKVIWSKPNPMPASVRDRLSAKWEPVYLLTRSPTYFFDLHAIRIPPRQRTVRRSRVGSDGKYFQHDDSRPSWAGPHASGNAGLARMRAEGRSSHPAGKNPGDVWTIPTAAYKGAHFATFPEHLVERPLKATCPERVCTTCGAPWWPPNEVQHGSTPRLLRKSCGCAGRSWEPGIVLDPFMGAGTTAVAAKKAGRRWIGIELNPTYAALATQRIASVGSTDQTQGSA